MQRVPLRPLMKIVVNTRFLLPEYPERYGYFLHELFMRITENHPEHDFLFLLDRPFDSQFVFGPGVKTRVIGPAAKSPILWKLWFDYRVTSILRQYNADVFVSADGLSSLRTKVPQCIIINELRFFHNDATIKKSHLQFYKKYTPRFLKKVMRVAAISKLTKTGIITQYKLAADKIDVIDSAAKESFQPLSFEEKEIVKEKYSDGKEYFIYNGDIQPRNKLLQLLKAFSLFKKRQQTNMKFVFAGKPETGYELFNKSLAAYKYRSDIVITGILKEDELAKLTGAAFGLVYPSASDGFGVPVLEAMQAGVPVITSANSPMQEITESSALYAAVNNNKDMAEQMMRLYKDENLQKELIARGKIIASQYKLDKSAEQLLKSIVNAVG